ncbi:MAG: transcription antitermination factor NusB [Planctomycetota bacterium]|nr:transcription antitermination factor NusB [Planctomycetota bacterium]
MSHPRTAGREAALQYLYMHDVLTGKDVPPFPVWLGQQHPPPDADSAAFAGQLVDAVLQHLTELDADIAAVAANWDVARMAVVDRNILRLGLAELTVHPDTSHKIILNEAVELAKRYSSEDAGAFVNGLLDKLRIKLRPETVSESNAAAEPAGPGQDSPAG